MKLIRNDDIVSHTSACCQQGSCSVCPFHGQHRRAGARVQDVPSAAAIIAAGNAMEPLPDQYTVLAPDNDAWVELNADLLQLKEPVVYAVCFLELPCAQAFHTLRTQPPCQTMKSG
jgi:hypothetical protein